MESSAPDVAPSASGVPAAQAQDVHVWTPYGCGVRKSGHRSDGFVEVALGWSVASLRDCEAVTHIPMRVKPFFGACRDFVPVSVNLNSSVGTLRATVAERLGVQASSLTLVLPSWTLRRPADAEMLHTLGLRMNGVIVALSRGTLALDPASCTGMAFSNSNLTVAKLENGYSTARGREALSAGRHYWEVRIDSYVDDEDVFVGVCAPTAPLDACPYSTDGQFWGYLATSGSKFCIGLEEYGAPSRTGDVLGVLLEFAPGEPAPRPGRGRKKRGAASARGGGGGGGGSSNGSGSGSGSGRSQVATISFFKNGVNMGVAHTGVPAPVYPAVCLYYVGAQATLRPGRLPVVE